MIKKIKILILKIKIWDAKKGRLACAGLYSLYKGTPEEPSFLEIYDRCVNKQTQLENQLKTLIT